MNKKQELEKLYILRGKILDVMTGAADSAELSGYSYNDADGSQSVQRRSPRDLMEWLKEIDKKIALLERQLAGCGLMTFGTNRYAGT